jgi:hypothetical protein
MIRHRLMEACRVHEGKKYTDFRLGYGMETNVWLLSPADLYPVSIIQGDWGGKVKIWEVIVSVIMRGKKRVYNSQ